MIDCINAKLSNDLGNLAYRTLSFAYKHCDQLTPQPKDLLPEDELMLGAARDLLPVMRGLIDDLTLHRVTQSTNAVVQQANRYIDTQAPWALRKSDPERMATVLWVLMETLRHIGILSQPVTPSIAAALLDQLAVPADARSFDALTVQHQLIAGTPLPLPGIIIPRHEAVVPPAEDLTPAAAAPAEEPTLTATELEALELQVQQQADRVRALKEEGAGKQAVGEAVGELLTLKSQLPEGHALKGGGKKPAKAGRRG
uniref:WHEP-TRS domain-containing protein n=1 Tax=Haptolina ericina TaxID=156174 RepID=A0A7S3AI82_9EUKA